MRVFVTGATGFVGSAVVDELRRRGHDVVGLARSDRSAEVLRKAGVEVHRGDIAEPDTIKPALGRADAVIHTAFNHDFTRYVANCEADGRLLNEMAHALNGAGKTLIATSATVAAAGEPVTEADDAAREIPRSASEVFLGHSVNGVQTGVVRLPPTVHGPGDAAFVPALIALARDRGASAYVDKGENRWPAVHRDDAARLFCDAVERRGSGARYHAVAETGVAFREIAEAIGEGLSLPVRSVPKDRAAEHFGWLAMFATLDNPTSSEWTRAATGWAPREAELVSDMRASGYFDASPN